MRRRGARSKGAARLSQKLAAATKTCGKKWKIWFGADAPPRDGADQSVADVDWRRLDAKDAGRSKTLRQALILNGVDFNGARALVSPCHTDAIIDETLAAFTSALRTMKEEGLA